MNIRLKKHNDNIVVFRQGVHPHTLVRQTQNLYMSRYVGEEGQGQGKSNSREQGGTAVGRGGGEGGPANPGYLDSGDVQHSLNFFREY